ncbi:MAG: radical SAM protein [Planctomycetes bacterium]|nr:radical SAM protein [Planctomycetota bacterium]
MTVIPETDTTDAGAGPPRADPPLVGIEDLDELWFQVSGTLCNLACSHCFISCHPGNRAFGFLGLGDVKRRLEEARRLGVKEYYFTGGEPFLNREMVPILEETLRHGPASVLTNGTVFRDATAADLARIAKESRYSLEVRVSIDGYDASMNDPLRGDGTWEAAMRGVEVLVSHGLLPIVTIVQTWPDEETLRVLDRFRDTLRLRGYARPRIKVLPTLRIGMEASRTRGYLPHERVTPEMLEGYDAGQLLCSHSRIVTDRGVAVCPILIEAPGAHLGLGLEEALRPFAITHAACTTCYQHGAICTNLGAGGAGRDR